MAVSGTDVASNAGWSWEKARYVAQHKKQKQEGQCREGGGVAKPHRQLVPEFDSFDADLLQRVGSGDSCRKARVALVRGVAVYRCTFLSRCKR